MAPIAQFRIFHLLLLILLAAIALWLATNTGMKTAQVEVLDMSALSFLGPNGSNDNFGPHQAQLRFRCVKPESLSDTVVNVFLNTTAVTRPQSEFGEKNILVFRFRQEPVLWMRPDDPVREAVRRLGFQTDEIEEVIMAIYPADFTPE